MHSTTNLYLGNDPTKWRRAIPTSDASKRQHCTEAFISLTTATAATGIRSHRNRAPTPSVSLRLKGTDGSLDNRWRSGCGPDPEASAGLSNGCRWSAIPLKAVSRKCDGRRFPVRRLRSLGALVFIGLLGGAVYSAGAYSDIAYAIGPTRTGWSTWAAIRFDRDVRWWAALIRLPWQGTRTFFSRSLTRCCRRFEIIYVTYIGGNPPALAMTAMNRGFEGRRLYDRHYSRPGTFPMAIAAQATIGGSLQARRTHSSCG